MARTEAIILSMTQKERDNPAILNASRKKRISYPPSVHPRKF